MGSSVRWPSARHLLPLAAAMLVHAAALAAVAVLWRAELEPIAPGSRRAPTDPVRFLVAIPAPQIRAAERAPARAPVRSTVESQPSDTDMPLAPPANPSPGVEAAAPGTDNVAGKGWAFSNEQPSSRFTEATLRSVMADLPARPDCEREQLRQFHCSQLQARWSLDSSIRVNLNCANVMLAHKHYAECIRHPAVAVDSSPQERVAGDGAAPGMSE